ncbi:DNA polymerase III subunit chi [Betaproteobacteria bacterium]|nr:DNA polymerase III subunit chi [Betaproteobacteria bacterium]GHU10097.1 DNA polymerase III subunit chi [Betaproteobacteria bacterium]GHU14414.1 DNA polymerase III subunit chi [Betaproteobacteria bacterium]GHU41995.1 DNA polymerase III subunit chi [Betaproteobacteria bacterium]
MPKVFFYHNVQDRLRAAAALIAKTYAQGKNFTVFVPDPEQAAFLDRLLWTQAPLGFLPHCRADSELASVTPIILTERMDAPLLQNERLLNLGGSVPDNIERFQSLIEIVDQSEKGRGDARLRTRHYKEMGYPVQFIDMNER